MTGEPLGPRELSSLYSTAQSWSAGLQGGMGLACVLVGAAAWESTL